MSEALELLVKHVRSGAMSIEVARMSAGVLYGRRECTPSQLTKFERAIK